MSQALLSVSTVFANSAIVVFVALHDIKVLLLHFFLTFCDTKMFLL